MQNEDQTSNYNIYKKTRKWYEVRPGEIRHFNETYTKSSLSAYQNIRLSSLLYEYEF